MERQPDEHRPEESEQLPEEAPAEHVPGDDRERGSAPQRSGGRGRSDGRTATGNPRSAGARDGEERGRDRS
jgi:hypothetical protein